MNQKTDITYLHIIKVPVFEQRINCTGFAFETFSTGKLVNRNVEVIRTNPALHACTASLAVLHNGPMFGASHFIWMAYLSLRVMVCPLTPSSVLLLGQACCESAARPHSEGMRLLKSVYLGVQLERAVNQWDRRRASGYCFTRKFTCTHITIHTFPPICYSCIPTPTICVNYVWHDAYGNSGSQLPRTKTNHTKVKNIYIDRSWFFLCSQTKHKHVLCYYSLLFLFKLTYIYVRPHHS